MSKQQTAVEWLSEQFDSIVELYPSQFERVNRAIEQAKEMEKEQSHLYSAFCFKCINEKMPIIKFEDWINLGGGEQ
jgi:hypothetical protein